MAVPELQFRQKERARAASITANIFSPELKSFSAQKIRSDFSVRTFFKYVGSQVSQAGAYIKENAKKIAVIAAVSTAFAAALFFAFKLKSSY